MTEFDKKDVEEVDEVKAETIKKLSEEVNTINNKLKRAIVKGKRYQNLVIKLVEEKLIREKNKLVEIEKTEAEVDECLASCCEANDLLDGPVDEEWEDREEDPVLTKYIEIYGL